MNEGEVDQSAIDHMLDTSRAANEQVRSIVTGLGVEIPDSVPVRRSIPVRVE
jgi:hypothetical protein